MITEELTIEQKVEFRRMELNILKNSERLIKTNKDLFRLVKRDIHMRCFLRRILKISKWNVFKFIIDAPLHNLLFMWYHDKRLIKRYWRVKRNLKIAEEIYNDNLNFSF
jgi:hypothetical protein